ncbi:NAD-dependent epimerase/dehydratase family protein [Nodosilinea sp. LEGE 07088]|nr:NAD-dependent epimerase/dehydratase family protein [Nodosilinea sp. LEGE 07088]
MTQHLHAQGLTVRATGRNPQIGQRLAQSGLEFIAAELSDPLQTTALCQDIDWIFHCGAKTSLWGTKVSFWQSNVLGTRYLAAAALKANCRRFIHISSPSIYFRFATQLNLDENTPLPKQFINHYAASKAAAEAEIQAAVGQGLNALILRPRAIYGPGDRTIFPRLLRALQHKKLPIIGDGQTLTDLTYIDNCVNACLCAAQATLPPSGRCYNITDGQPQLLWQLLTHIATELQLPIPNQHISSGLARRLAQGLEYTFRALHIEREPLLTEYAVGLLSCTTTLAIDRARLELGYSPQVSTAAGIAQVLNWWQTTTC